MVDLAAHNAKVSLNNKFELISRNSQERLKLLKNLEHKWELERQLELKHSIILIFKVSYSVAMVTFVDGKPDKKNYRKYKIKTVKV
ncbi:hypothetical protein ACVNP0_15265 [Staphylococcus aureus]